MNRSLQFGAPQIIAIGVEMLQQSCSLMNISIENSKFLRQLLRIKEEHQRNDQPPIIFCKYNRERGEERVKNVMRLILNEISRLSTPRTKHLHNTHTPLTNNPKLSFDIINIENGRGERWKIFFCGKNPEEF
mmetsp:Transcript_36345/g.49927  ORF Transcript_36345/g.49927 Transcript_36345/m.49927 type:complete len:132 (-) Transcript_36345:153-548(-)